MKTKQVMVLFAILVIVATIAFAGYDRSGGRTYFVNRASEATLWRGTDAYGDIVLLNTVEVFEDTIYHLQNGGYTNKPGTGHFELLVDGTVTVENNVNNNKDVEWELDDDGNLQPKL
jgi:hypothetical protein